MRKKILLIEDDEQMAELLQRFLVEQELEVSHVIRPSQALALLELEKFDLIILDLSLPEMDGLDLCVKIREITDIYIVISSARSDLDDKLVGFENGADDYLPKPYSPRELLARIKSIFKREGSVKAEKVASSRFKVDEDSTQIVFDEEVLKLTLAEYEILKLLIKRIGNTVSREEIANSIDSHRFDSGVESINILIGRIRKKLDPHKYDTFIQTVRGIGYRFVEN
ncbi:MAG: DNA-binding response regulator [uncultured Sulfurovum sp.]|uniref:DNA-binding response regulator n=1 Tax=uncultured Sulfurovum sp. TaxID=269237 RepID=A0A6S6TP66_9BACT|nr:MAG: DNA-binding response regulator [uncultured Sulfurovum sp.]